MPGKSDPNSEGSVPPNRTAAAFALLLSATLAAASTPAGAQVMDDMPLVARRTIDVGVAYSTDRWSRYWEGTLERTNQNIGKLTTESVALVAGYGVTDRFDVMASLPYVRTTASQGTLHQMSGVQDFMLTGRYRILRTPFTSRAMFNATVVGAVGAPASNYTPDYLPLSIGSASRRATGRMVIGVQSNEWWFVNGSAGYTWRANVHLDRTAYFTQDQLYLTNEVEMPDVADYSLSAGYRAGRLCIPFFVTQQRTRGGGDIRRQDMPFVSNRMDFVKAGASVMYTLPVAQPVAIQLGAMRTLSGRNVGNSETYTAGVSYAIHR